MLGSALFGHARLGLSRLILHSRGSINRHLPLGYVAFGLLHQQPEPFFVELNEALKAHNLQGVLGIRSLKTSHGKKPEMEITKGRSNITFDYDSDAAEDDNAIEASWAFGGAGMPTTLSFCTSYCSSRSDYGGHSRYHSVSARSVIGFH